MTEAPWSDADSLAAAIEAAPDSLDLYDAYMAEARTVFGEEFVERVGWPQVGYALGMKVVELAGTDHPLPFPTTYELVALATAKRLLARYRDQLFDAGAMDGAFRAADFRQDLDPSVIQFNWALLAARSVLGVEDLPRRLADYAMDETTSLLVPRFA